MDEPSLLISRYCDNDLSAADRDRLIAWLREDDQHAYRLARELLLHSRLQDLLQQQEMQSLAWVEALDAAPGPGDPKAGWPVVGKRRWVSRLAVLAACLALAVGVGYWFKPPAVVAQVSRIAGAAVTSRGEKLAVGDLLVPGERLRIDRGVVLLTFECGAQVLVEAPAVFVPEHAMACTLERGGASAQVPTQAIGFTLSTPLARITDLGTEFRLRWLDESRFDLHVFDGLVEVGLNRRFKHALDAPLTISEGRSIRFDAETGELQTLDFEESLRPTF
ncbi:FecR protein [Pirellulimonas nuda]|uniref:FecR protein n=2 Tax=Pirellulimonas nuda TaxID=2528009 RepID=A0A518DC96_9BACT|nr:FecR protein [Pirellulimonas nuda]